ncbi:hypothetical protein EDB19DRAFT_1893659 [Suillus lakei]|nr:hypothetical protein EDB19DRAFT_1893659 [Suillus lakei]
MDFSTMIPPIGEEGFAVSHGARLAYAWADQYEALVNAYLQFCLQNPLLACLNASVPASENTFSIGIIDIFSSSPLQPTVYRHTHRVCLRLSIHTEAKKLCHLHGVCYSCYLAEQFRVAFDVYLEILRQVSLRVSQALGHTGLNWCARNSCHYKVQDEPELRFPFEIALDGNNSVKFVDPALHGGREHLDPCNGQLDIWIDEEYIDWFKDEVQNAQHCHRPNTSTPTDTVDPDDPWVDCKNDEQDLNEPVNVC